MNEPAQPDTPHIGIFWLVQSLDGKARLLAAGCPLDQAEPYGDCLTYGPGHYDTWAVCCRDRTVDHALHAVVRSYEYEDWSRGRIVFDRSRDLFVLYADRKLLTPAMIVRIKPNFICRRSASRSKATGTIRATRRRPCQGHDPCRPERRLSAPRSTRPKMSNEFV